jgi:hypothetical protein
VNLLVFSRAIVGAVLRSLINVRPQEQFSMDFLNKAEKLAKLSGRLHGSGNHDGGSSEGGGGGGGGAGNVIHSIFSHATTSTSSHEGGPKRNTSVSEIYRDAQMLYETAAGKGNGKTGDMGKIAGAAGGVLGGISSYGHLENSQYGKYITKAEDFLDSYGKKHVGQATMATATGVGHSSQPPQAYHGASPDFPQQTYQGGRQGYEPQAYQPPPYQNHQEQGYGQQGYPPQTQQNYTEQGYGQQGYLPQTQQNYTEQGYHHQGHPHTHQSQEHGYEPQGYQSQVYPPKTHQEYQDQRYQEQGYAPHIHKNHQDQGYQQQGDQGSYPPQTYGPSYQMTNQGNYQVRANYPPPEY